MAKSAGIVLFRNRGACVQVLLVHPGGPFWARRDDGAWSIPKGEFGADETPEVAARREFSEEIGELPPGALIALEPVAQSRAKTVHAFALEGDIDVAGVSSNIVTMEWPPRSGRSISFPEVDRANWFDLDVARTKILAGQRPILEQLVAWIQRGDSA